MIRLPRLLRLSLVLLLVAMAITGAGLAVEESSPAAARKNWWELDRAHRCGRMWCSRVVSPHIPLGPGEPKITLAVRPGQGEEPAAAATRVEARSTAVATTLRQISRELAVRLASSPETARERRPLSFWLDRQAKPRHPLTPTLAVGVKNRNPVIYLPANASRQGPQATLITLTEPDSLANGVDLPTLAERWKEILEGTLSEALWGASLSRTQPWARWLWALLSLGLGALGVGLCSVCLQRLYRHQRQGRADLRVRQQELQAAADSAATLRESQRLELRLRRAALLVKALQVLRIALAAMALTIALHLFPATRLVSAFLLQQSVGLPVIWIGMVLLETLLLWAVMRRLNRWAVDAQACDPASRRPRLRLETNARVLKGSVAAGTTLLGLYLTVLLFGIDPQILAGAGIVAVALGFLARGLVEDVVGGIRILATDRFAIGDSIAVEGHAGLVEAMNLIHTQLRGGEGQVVTIPNGMIRVIENRSQDWARVNFELDIAWASDLERACAVLQEVAAQLAEDPDWKDQISEPPQLLGVERLEQSGVRLRLWIRTLPLKQWGVAREFRHRLKGALDAAGIEPGVPQQVIRRG
jgi:small conductance mechanosensitive channel